MEMIMPHHATCLVEIGSGWPTRKGTQTLSPVSTDLDLQTWSSVLPESRALQSEHPLSFGTKSKKAKTLSVF